jgi:hypothetical protein
MTSEKTKMRIALTPIEFLPVANRVICDTCCCSQQKPQNVLLYSWFSLRIVKVNFSLTHAKEDQIKSLRLHDSKKFKFSYDYFQFIYFRSINGLKIEVDLQKFYF